jgi:hypothetical protein
MGTVRYMHDFVVLAIHLVVTFAKRFAQAVVAPSPQSRYC